MKTVALDIFSKTADSAMTSVLNTAIEQCIAMQDEFKKKMMPGGPPPPPHGSSSGQKRCPPDAKFFTRCVEMNVFRNCPTEKVVDSEECAKLNEFAEKCLPEA